MSYKRLNLSTGDVLTEAHLKHLEDGIDSVANHPWQEAKMGFIGDSITWGYDGTSLSKTSITPYWKLLAEMLGGTTSGNAEHAYGINGSTIGVGINQPMCNRVTNLDNSVDIQFIFGGTNDFDIGNIPIKMETNSPLTEFIANEQIIHLETIDKALIGEVGKLYLDSLYIYVLDKIGQEVLIFNKSGKFNSKISALFEEV